MRGPPRACGAALTGPGREHPLAVYVFTHDAKFEQKVFANTKSGAAVVNEVVITAGGACRPPCGRGKPVHLFGFSFCSCVRCV